MGKVNNTDWEVFLGILNDQQLLEMSIKIVEMTKALESKLNERGMRIGKGD